MNIYIYNNVILYLFNCKKNTCIKNIWNFDQKKEEEDKHKRKRE